MNRLLWVGILLFVAACGTPQAPTANPTPNPPVSAPSQVTLLLSDPVTDQDVSVVFDLPEGWQITAGLSNTRIVVIPTLKPLGEGNPSPAESVAQSVGTSAESVTVDGREIFVATGGAPPNALMSFAVSLPERNYFLQVNVTQIFEGAAEDYREALQRITASARVVE